MDLDIKKALDELRLDHVKLVNMLEDMSERIDEIIEKLQNLSLPGGDYGTDF